MSEVKLTPEENAYYIRLFAEDKKFYTVVDSIRQLSMFKGRFHNDSEALAFIEFISNIFHICWKSDVFDKNHLRLMDILFGLQHAIEFHKDKEAESIIERLLASFTSIFEEKRSQIRRRVFASQKDLVSRFQRSIPNKSKLEKYVAYFLHLSRPYAAQFVKQLSAGKLPTWKVRDRKGITVHPLNYETIRVDPKKRAEALAEYFDR